MCPPYYLFKWFFWFGSDEAAEDYYEQEEEEEVDDVNEEDAEPEPGTEEALEYGIFNPPLYKQRYSYALQILKSSQWIQAMSRIVDIGCAGKEIILTQNILIEYVSMYHSGICCPIISMLSNRRCKIVSRMKLNT